MPVAELRPQKVTPELGTPVRLFIQPAKKTGAPVSLADKYRIGQGVHVIDGLLECVLPAGDNPFQAILDCSAKTTGLLAPRSRESKYDRWVLNVLPAPNGRRIPPKQVIVMSGWVTWKPLVQVEGEHYTRERLAALECLSR